MTNLELAQRVNAAITGDYTVCVGDEEDELYIDVFLVVPEPYGVESILGTITKDGFGIYYIGEDGEEHSCNKPTIYEALRYVFEELESFRVRCEVGVALIMSD